MSVIGVLKSIFAPSKTLASLPRPDPFDEDKAILCHALGQMDRQLTDAEWKRFGDLVREGY